MSSVQAAWEQSKCYMVASRRLNIAQISILGKLAQQGSPAVLDAIEQFEMLPDEDELINTLTLLTSMSSLNSVFPDAAERAAQVATFVPVAASDVHWTQVRRAKTEQFEKEIEELNIQHLSREEQITRLSGWLNQHSRRVTAPSRVLVPGSESQRLSKILQIVSMPSTDIAKSTAGASTTSSTFQFPQSLHQAAIQLVRGNQNKAPIVQSQQQQQQPQQRPPPPGPAAVVKRQSPSILRWSRVGSVLVYSAPELSPSHKIASFDMDHTLITPKSGAKFPANANDWKWMFPEVPTKLKELYNQGYKIVIFSNQAGISKGQQRESDITDKITQMCQQLDIPIQAFLATKDDEYRKPSTKMWELFVNDFNGYVPVLPEASFYCGDAAGRVADHAAKRKKDFSASDRAFAANVKLPFHTETELFLGHPQASYEWDSIDPHAVLHKHGSDHAKFVGAKSEPTYGSSSQEMIIFVGPPASGKSTFAKRNLVPFGYVHINQDTLKTKEKCVHATIQALKAGKSVVVDNTSPSADIRAGYIALAREHGVPVRCFYFNTDIELAKHLNMLREKTQGVPHVPDVGYNIFKSRVEKPHVKEGFKEVKIIEFTPQFDSAQQMQTFLQRT